MPSKAQLTVSEARMALTNALASLDDTGLRLPLTFTVDPGPPRHPHDGPLDVRVDAHGLSMCPLGLTMRDTEAVRLSWAELEQIGADLTLHERLVRESDAMDADLRFLRSLYFRHGGVLRLKLRGKERKTRHSRIHDICLKLHSPNSSLRSA